MLDTNILYEEIDALWPVKRTLAEKTLEKNTLLECVKTEEQGVALKNKIEIVVIFLAILELIKMKEVVARQSELFQDIEIARNTNNIIPYERRDQTHPTES